MGAWSYLLVVFMAGFGLGAIFTFLWFKARLRFYKHFIEDRLSALNLPQVLTHASRVR
jgi:uncharacterized membrane protein YciS (DUF1049 family)